MSVLEDEKKRVHARQEKLKTLLPRLSALISVAGARPSVNYYEDLEGLQTMRTVLFSSKAAELLVMGSPEKYEEVVGKDSSHIHNYRLERSPLKVRQLVLYSKNKKISPAPKGISWKYIKTEALEPGEIAIFGDYIALISYLDKPYGFLVKSKEIARVGKLMFEAAWLTGKAKP